MTLGIGPGGFPMSSTMLARTDPCSRGQHPPPMPATCFPPTQRCRLTAWDRPARPVHPPPTVLAPPSAVVELP